MSHPNLEAMVPLCRAMVLMSGNTNTLDGAQVWHSALQNACEATTGREFDLEEVTDTRLFPLEMAQKVIQAMAILALRTAMILANCDCANDDTPRLDDWEAALLILAAVAEE